MALLSEEIESKIDIVEFISNYIALKKAGINFKARCPFHSEKTPSFFISPDRQIWHCFGCGLGGGVIKFYMLIENASFSEALEYFSEKLGLNYRKNEKTALRQKKEILEALETATKYFENQLFKKTNQEILEYLTKKRGLNLDTIKHFRLGYSQPSYDDLKKYLLSQGFKVEVLKTCGLFIIKDDGGFYDRFRNRIMFPVFDMQNRVVGFSARIYEPRLEANQNKDEIAKYINTPNTLVYNKSRVLYLLNSAKKSIKESDQVIIVEGNMDALMSHQTGITNVIATSGTSLNNDHLMLIKRFTGNIVFSFDNDAAGKLAKERAIKLSLAAGFNIYVLNPSSEKDPADIIKFNPDQWREIVRNKKKWLDHLFEQKLREYPLNSVDNKKMFVKSVLPYIKVLQNPVERSEWIKTIADVVNVDEIYIREALKIMPRSELIETGADYTQNYKNNPKPLHCKKFNKRELYEKYLLTLILKHQAIINNELLQLDPGDFSYEPFAQLFNKIKALAVQKEPFSINNLNKDEKEKISFLLIEAELLNLEESKVKEEFETTVIKLKKEKIRTEISDLKQLIKEYAKTKKIDEQKKTLISLNQKIKELKFK